MQYGKVVSLFSFDYEQDGVFEGQLAFGWPGQNCCHLVKDSNLTPMWLHLQAARIVAVGLMHSSCSAMKNLIQSYFPESFSKIGD